MRTKLFIPVVVAILSVAALMGAACSDDDGDSDSAQPAAEGQEAVSGPGSDSTSAIVIETFLTFEGSQYRLEDIFQADLIDSEFNEAGEASEFELDGDSTVYIREGDEDAVYTFWEGAGEGEEAFLDSWYRWEREG
jgi:hypothetical protein